MIDVAAFADATVHQLDDHSSIVHVHGQVTGHDELLRPEAAVTRRSAHERELQQQH
ncbi:hypothetical protein [Mycolicibacterium sp. P9-64]|uniref:hypothetical protein n=1 Tax=Mycolicibacterium sp. P9-64 TaxID=2024612 RepID=UPI0015638F59|nr:hypothetical protein [Mycolicibacterium sp. P9-64]